MNGLSGFARLGNLGIEAQPEQPSRGDPRYEAFHTGEAAPYTPGQPTGTHDPNDGLFGGLGWTLFGVPAAAGAILGAGLYPRSRLTGAAIGAAAGIAAIFIIYRNA